ncbi:PRTRC system ThiF family protein [Vibrio sp. 1180_3]|uniref:PRTRC system ThiF family protein n=1 Tax=Vibrio sp. 1180_3 TaxID=2528832 RepID=UPI002405A924|nr:PRTRC system ThiF family protein [Vibrio sp. 1180_3]MDF9399069.1 PRTRC system ThiF family protein [Vibrio sp. 1180_3]
MYKLPIHKLGKPVKVALIGVGGTGSALAQEIIRLDTTLLALDSQCGLDVHVYDGGTVTEANITRQTFFPTQVGVNKAEAVVWTANNLHGKHWHSYPVHANVEKLLGHQFDLIITALDRPSVRYQLSKLTPRGHTLWLDMGNNATQGQVLLGEMGSTKYLPNICDLYDYSTLTDDDAEIKSCSAEQSINRQELGVNQFAARIGAQILWNLYRHGKIQSHGAYFDAKTLHVDPIFVDESVWAMYGYTPRINNPSSSASK